MCATRQPEPLTLSVSLFSRAFPALPGELSLGFRLEMVLVRARCTNLRAFSVFCIAFPINAPTGNRVRLRHLSLCDFPRSGTALWRERKAPAGPGTGGAQGARILRGAAPEAGTPHQGPSSRHPPAVWRRARRGLRLLGTRHVPASRHASERGTVRAPGARRGALAAPLLRQTRGGWSSWGFGGRSSLT